MPEDFDHGGGSGVRAEGEIFRAELLKDGGCFIGFAGVGFERVLQEWIGREGNFRGGDHSS